MNPLSRALAAFASMIGFHGCDASHLAGLKPGSAGQAGEAKFPLKPEVVREWRIDPVTPGNSTWFHVHFSPGGFVTRTSRREESPVG